jgi:hypothetical protein
MKAFLMVLQDLTDESILRLYESVRNQVSADIRLGSKHRLLGETAKRRAQQLLDEIDRRRLQVTPIDWK